MCLYENAFAYYLGIKQGLNSQNWNNLNIIYLHTKNYNIKIILSM